MGSNLWQLAGKGGLDGYDTAQATGAGITSMALPLSFINPGLGAATAIGGGLTSLISGAIGNSSKAAEGRRRFNAGQSAYQSAIANNPDKYSMSGITGTYDKARNMMNKSISSDTNALLDRYNSVQRRQMRNKINSGLTAGAAQANNIQNNLAFQQQANRLFQSQAQQKSNLALREGQAKFQATDLIDARKSRLATRSLIGQGVTDPTALATLSERLGT